MIGYMKYFENGRKKNMSFMIKDHKVWNVIKDKVGIPFHSEPVYAKILDLKVF